MDILEYTGFGVLTDCDGGDVRSKLRWRCESNDVTSQDVGGVNQKNQNNLIK